MTGGAMDTGHFFNSRIHQSKEDDALEEVFLKSYHS